MRRDNGGGKEKHIPRAGQQRPSAALPSGSGQGGLGLSSKRGRAGAKLRRWATGLGYTIILSQQPPLKEWTG